MKRIDQLPESDQIVSRAALQSTLLRILKDEVFAATPIGISGQKDVALGSLANVTNERASNALQAISAAFPDDEFMKETLQLTLGAMENVSLASRMKTARSGSDTAVNLGIKQSVSTGILFAFGYMNPTAAAARKLTTGQIEAMEKLSKQQQQEVIGKVLASPIEFAEMAKGIAEGLTPKNLEILREEFLRASAFNIRYQIRIQDTNEEDEDSQMLGLFSSGIDLLGKGVNSVTSFFK